MDERLVIDAESVAERCASFIKKTVLDAGAEGIVVGLSGGVDSSVVAVLGVRALGADRVTGLILPYKTSSPESKADALLLAERFSIETFEFDITPLVDSYFGKFGDADRVRIGNFAARMRMAVLFDFSKKTNRLVAGTGNRTEYLLGYFTLYGDGACAMLPIGGLFKTQVWQLAEYLKLPKRIIEKTPSADLWEGQTDEGELGIEYREMDSILHRLLDSGMSAEEVSADGFEADKVKLVLERMKATEFKRRLPSVCTVE